MATANLERIIDGDGHIMEDIAGIVSYMPEEFRGKSFGEARAERNPFPPIDHLHSANRHITPPGAFANVGPDGWMEFLDDVGVDSTVLYTTSGLGFGKIVSRDWAVMLARAYNNWVYDTYVSRGDRFQAMGLLPLQEPAAAAEELRRIVEELGFVGAMLPSTGAQQSHLGDAKFGPVYAEAERLGVPLAIHGGAHHDLGMNTMNVFAATHAIGHPVGIMICLAGMLFNGVFERFTGLKVGFLEGGVGWFLMALERFNGSYEAFTPYDPRGELMTLPDGMSVRDYMVSLCKEGRLRVGVEGDEPALAYAVHAAGPEAFIFSSDFPHEVNLGSIRHEIEELIEIEELSPEEKEAILWRNSLDFYNLTSAAA